MITLIQYSGIGEHARFSVHCAVITNASEMEDGVTFDMITRKVLMTGFAPFGMLDRNPSWDGVDAIRKEEVEMKHNIEFFKEQIEVRYTHVDESVPRLWRELQPDVSKHLYYY